MSTKTKPSFTFSTYLDRFTWPITGRTRKLARLAKMLELDSYSAVLLDSVLGSVSNLMAAADPENADCYGTDHLLDLALADSEERAKLKNLLNVTSIYLQSSDHVVDFATAITGHEVTR